MAKNKKGRSINGILLLDKSSGMSSNKALQQIKRLFDAKKAGHTGSLDPIATGILPICLGEATKFAGYLLNNDKAYFVKATLGKTTTTLDIEGEVTSEKSIRNITANNIKKIINNFIGRIEQVPPMYSALKRNGVPLYKLARKGIEVERKPRSVKIYKIEFLGYKNGELSLNIYCSKGTYIRTLIDDIGEKLGCGGFVNALRRIEFAHLKITDSFKFAELENLSTAELDKKLIKSENIVPNMPNINLNSEQIIDINFGRRIYFTGDNGLVKIFNNDIFYGIGEIEGDILMVKRLFIQ